MITTGLKTCIICGRPRSASECLKHRNDLLGIAFTICKECANECADFSDETSIINICRLANLPFVHDIYYKLVRDTDRPNFSLYMQKIAPYKKFIDYNDSVFDSVENTQPVEQIEVTDKIIVRWGDGLTPEKYAYLEKALQSLLDIKPATTVLEINRYVQNIKLKESFDQALSDGDYRAISQLRKAYEEDLKSLGLDAVLSSKDNSSKNIGQKIRDVEMTRPIPERDEYKDAAKIEAYIDKWFVTNMKRNFGLASEEEQEALYENERAPQQDEG